jgi:predicted protein tyrosine phosphatase
MPNWMPVIKSRSRSGAIFNKPLTEDTMHIAIASRLIAEKASALIKTPHAIISITDPDSDLPAFALNENRLGILSLQFYDIEDISAEMSLKDAVEYLTQFGDGLFKDDQASQIVDFVELVKDKAEGLLVHCEAGVSRSAAVAAAIELMLNSSNERVFNDRRYSPNLYVYSKLLLAWQKKLKERPDLLLFKGNRRAEDGADSGAL